jgi:hypothetical protein
MHLRVTMGHSRGWGDTYPWGLVGQYLDITGLPDGRYRLRVTADGNSADRSDRFLDSDETNNSTWADLQITGDTVTVLEYGPSARRSAKEHTTDVVGLISDQGPKSNHLGLPSILSVKANFWY